MGRNFLIKEWKAFPRERFLQGRRRSTAGNAARIAVLAKMECAFSRVRRSGSATQSFSMNKISPKFPGVPASGTNNAI